VIKYIPLEGEPRHAELRVAEPTHPVTEIATTGEGEDVFRIAKAEGNIVVVAMIFVSLAFMENTALHFREIQALFQSPV